LKYFKQALKIAKKQGNIKEIAHKLAKIASIDVSNDKCNVAQKKLEDALEIFETINDYSGQIGCLSQISRILFERDEYSEALDYSKKQLELSQIIDDKSLITSAYLDIGKCLLRMGKESEAMDYAKSGLQNCEDYEIIDELYLAYALLGDCYYNIHDYQNACSCYNRVVALRKKMGLEFWSYAYSYEKKMRMSNVESIEYGGSEIYKDGKFLL